QGKLGQNYRKTMLCPQKDNQIPFPSGTSGKIDVFFNSLLSEGVAEKIIRLDSGKEIEQLRFSLRGIESLDVDKRGRLLLKKGSESVHFSAPVAFQEVGGKRVAVEVAYHLTGKKEYGFTLGDFDASLPVTVDPGLVASTLFRWRWNL
ncbi:hypothetical protein, partial [Thiolapillus sp.]